MKYMQINIFVLLVTVNILTVIPANAEIQIVVVGSEFSEKVVNVDTCESIEFINLDMLDHRLAYQDKGEEKSIYLWGLGLAGGKEADRVSIELESGTYHFRCLPHPWMHSITINVNINDAECRAERNTLNP